MAGAGDENRICTIRIELIDTNPLIWREVEAPTSITLDDLHEIIQATMNWHDEQLWEFAIAKQKYAPLDELTPLDEPASESGDILLHDILRPRRTTFHYLYDFRDEWWHRVVATRIRAPEAGITYPRYVSGERNAPVEDCGGPYRFHDMLETIAKYDNDDVDDVPEEWEDFDEWAETFDPVYVDVERIENDLRGMADRLRTQKRPRGRRPEAKAAVIQSLEREAALTDAIYKVLRAPKAAVPSRAKKDRS